jgi:menaquinone-dependent protoporphyrinogen oxidase
MSNKILVAYASMNGSTAGVAEAIGQTLLENGAQVEVCRVQDVKDLGSYGAVVVGSAIQEGKWLPAAMQFIHTNQAMLNQKPFAAFQVCMTMSMKNSKFRAGVVEWMEPVRALVKPVSEGYFAGKLDLEQVPSLRKNLLFRLSVTFGVWSEGDHRDWNAIRAWTNNLTAALQLQKAL